MLMTATLCALWVRSWAFSDLGSMCSPNAPEPITLLDSIQARAFWVGFLVLASTPTLAAVYHVATLRQSGHDPACDWQPRFAATDRRGSYLLAQRTPEAIVNSPRKLGANARCIFQKQRFRAVRWNNSQG